MSATDPHNKERTCVVEQTTTVIFEGSITARRKRMEIRRFKKVSCSTSPSRGLGSVQQGIFKRSRPLRASSICSICYSHDAQGDPRSPATPKTLDEGRVDLSPKLVAEFEVSQDLQEPCTSSEGDVLGGTRAGLVRSKSFPSECLNTRRCILHIRKATRDHVVMGVESHFATIVTEQHGSTCKETLAKFVPGKSEVKSSTDPNCVNEVPPVAPGESVLAMSRGSNDADMNDKQEDLPNEGATSSGRRSDTHMPDLAKENKVPGGAPDGSMASALTSGSAASELQAIGRCPLSGKVLVCGRRREMEDTAVIAPYFAQIPLVNGVEGSCALHFFAVYDGHGGPQASNFCADRLHYALTEELARSEVSENMGDDSGWRKVMTSCFQKIDKEVGGVCPNGTCDNIDSSATCCMNAIAPENVGTTAVVAVLSPSQIVIANCGDSRAVLSRGGLAIPVSKDHKPERDDETSRIEAAGGRVIYWDGYRVAGLLALSRALGDRYLKQYVISEPDVLCLPRADDDECLILASDGLWDVISNETACDVARRCLASARRRHEHRTSASGEDTACAQVAALLVKLAYGRGSKDNISVVVIDLKSRPS